MPDGRGWMLASCARGAHQLELEAKEHDLFQGVPACTKLATGSAALRTSEDTDGTSED